MKIISNKRIEDITSQRLSEFSKRFRKIDGPPIPIELIIENLFDLVIVWEEIEERGSECILGALRPQTRTVVINESRKYLYEDTPGLLHTTMGHELGHWDLFVDKSHIGQSALFNLGQNDICYRNSSKGEVQVLKALMKDQKLLNAYIEYKKRHDHPIVENTVNRYASALLMPKEMLKNCCQNIDISDWRSLYDLAELFTVSISALTVRLQRLNWIYITEDRKIVHSKEEYHGQESIF